MIRVSEGSVIQIIFVYLKNYWCLFLKKNLKVFNIIVIKNYI